MGAVDPVRAGGQNTGVIRPLKRAYQAHLSNNACQPNHRVVTMPAIAHFRRSIAAADHLIAMYAELRRSRNLGQRGRLDVANEDLLSLPRAAVVASMSALDAYVHAVLDERLPLALMSNPIPEALCDLMASTLPIKSAATFRDALPLLTAPDSLTKLCVKARDKTLAFVSYQAPEKISSAYELIGHPDVFESVAAYWQGPGTESEDIKRNLANYVRRRNQIAHEGDQEENGHPRPMRPIYAEGCRDFVIGLATRLNRVVYGV